MDFKTLFIFNSCHGWWRRQVPSRCNLVSHCCHSARSVLFLTNCSVVSVLSCCESSCFFLLQWPRSSQWLSSWIWDPCEYDRGKKVEDNLHLGIYSYKKMVVGYKKIDVKRTFNFAYESWGSHDCALKWLSDHMLMHSETHVPHCFYLIIFVLLLLLLNGCLCVFDCTIWFHPAFPY